MCKRTFFYPILSRISLAALFLSGIMISEAVAEHASFKNEVLPILNIYCMDCHIPGGEGFEKSGLDLSTYEGIMKGTKHGPVVIPGDAFSSNLMVLIEGRADKSLSMPHNGYRQEPTKKDRQVLRRWIAGGAENSTAFQNDVKPILELYCLECHLPGGIGFEKTGLDMRTYESLLKGTKHGPIIVPGDPFISNIMVLIEGRSKHKIHMPYIDKRSLSRWEKHLIRAWILRGAKNN